MKPTEEPGWVLIPPEEHERFLPLQPTDQVMVLGSNRWKRTWNSVETGFSPKLTYRRRIENVITTEQDEL